MRSHSRHYSVLHRMFVALLICKPSKNVVSPTISIFFKIEREVSVGWRGTAATVFTFQYREYQFPFDKINPSFTSQLKNWPIIASKLYRISFFESGMLLQQPIGLLQGVSVHFSNVHHPEKTTVRYLTSLGRCHISRWSRNTMARLELF